jgi:hypothetical protein
MRFHGEVFMPASKNTNNFWNLSARNRSAAAIFELIAVRRTAPGDGMGENAGIASLRDRQGWQA